MSENQDREDRLSQLADEFAARIRAGEKPTVSEYVARYPELAEEIRSTLPGVVAMEGLKARRGSSTSRVTALAGLTTDRLAEFRIIREIGRGGMGIVYEAEQESLSRNVAVKVLPPSVFQDEVQLARFKKEAETASRLQHPNIVPIYGVGNEDGVHYYTLQLIRGVGLDVIIRLPGMLSETAARAGKTPWKLVAHVGVQAAMALDHAHSQGVLHRDIKPSNLIVEPNGTTWVTDFGIAKVLDDQGLTRTGDFVGTLQYSPPEQFHSRFDARSDIYGLGLTLYEMLALHPAYRGSSKEELFRQAKDGAVESVSQVNPAVPRDLAIIVTKATAFDPDHRYPSAAALADDLQRFLADQPILARDITSVERLWRWCRRNPASATSAATALVAIVAAAVIGWLAYLSSNETLAREQVANAAVLESLAGQQAATQRAEANLTRTLEAFDDLFDAIAGRDQALLMSDEEISDVPVLPAVSEKELALLKMLLAFYDGFADENAGNERLRLDRARALRRVGDIHRWLGAFEEAERAYGQALKDYTSAEQEGFPVDGIDVAIVLKSLGHALADGGNVPMAQEQFNRAKALLTEMLEEFGGVRCTYELARVNNALGALVARRSEPMLQRLRPSFPQGRRGANPGRRFPGRGLPDLREIEGHHQQALGLANELLEVDPNNPEFRLLVARSKRLLAQALFVGNDIEAASIAIAEVITILEDLSSLFAEVPDYRHELVESYLLVGALHPSLDEAAREGRRAVETARELCLEYPDAPRYEELLAKSLRNLGRVLLESSPGRDRSIADEVARVFEESVDLRASLWRRFPYARHHLLELVLTRQALARLARRGGDLEGSRDLLEAAIGDLEGLGQGRGFRNQTARPLSNLYRELGVLHSRMGEPDLAREAHERAREANERARGARGRRRGR